MPGKASGDGIAGDGDVDGAERAVEAVRPGAGGLHALSTVVASTPQIFTRSSLP